MSAMNSAMNKAMSKAMSKAMNIANARNFMHEWVANPALRHHMETVAACMGAYADIVAPTEREGTTSNAGGTSACWRRISARSRRG